MGNYNDFGLYLLHLFDYIFIVCVLFTHPHINHFFSFLSTFCEYCKFANYLYSYFRISIKEQTAVTNSNQSFFIF